MRTCHGIDGTQLVSKREAKARFRKEILNDWSNACAYCGEVASTLDHVKPRHQGGQTVKSNLVAACLKCNQKKGSEDWRSWFVRQRFFCPQRAGRVDGWIGQAMPVGSSMASSMSLKTA